MNEAIKIIYNTLGQRALTMLGAKNIAYDNNNNSLLFQIQGSKEYNHVTIKYDGMRDLYDIRFVKFRGIDIKKEKELSGLYFDMIHSAITQNTGLYTSL